MNSFLLEINSTQLLPQEKFIVRPRRDIYTISNHQFIVKIWGDPIFDTNKFSFEQLQSNKTLVQYITQFINGHYYYFIINRKNNNYVVGNSLFSILPLYYTENKESLYLSSSSIIIAKHLKNNNRDKRFVLENILFNYPLFNRTAFNGVYLVNANSYLEYYNGNLIQSKHFQIIDYCNSNRITQKNNLDYLSDLFIERASAYFPNSNYYHALTGGFDGRTLVSCASHHEREFETFCFGAPTSSDLEIANTLALECSIPFNPIILDDDYLHNESLKNGIEFINNASGAASFARAHYLYASKKISKTTDIIVTGNFGSELFRTAHIAGAVFSPNLFRLFYSKDYSNAISNLKNAPENKWLINSSLISEWESLIEDLKTFPAFNEDFRGEPKNLAFYSIVFDEVFRKYFGAEMINQYSYLSNRTPFLDIQFLKDFLGSSLAGVHSNFKEKNPLKRFKGQLLYGNIIRKTNADLAHSKLDKGYRPDDLFSFHGKINIAKSYLRNKISTHNISQPDPYAVLSSFHQNKSIFTSGLKNQSIFNEQEIWSEINEPNPDNSLFVSLSQRYFLQND